MASDLDLGRGPRVGCSDSIGVTLDKGLAARFSHLCSAGRAGRGDQSHVLQVALLFSCPWRRA